MDKAAADCVVVLHASENEENESVEEIDSGVPAINQVTQQSVTACDSDELLSTIQQQEPTEDNVGLVMQTLTEDSVSLSEGSLCEPGIAELPKDETLNNELPDVSEFKQEVESRGSTEATNYTDRNVCAMDWDTASASGLLFQNIICDFCHQEIQNTEHRIEQLQVDLNRTRLENSRLSMLLVNERHEYNQIQAEVQSLHNQNAAAILRSIRLVKDANRKLRCCLASIEKNKLLSFLRQQ
eukprot:GILJ01016372.1.p1 GENE.GILJ01016372.1~~GILJ01016372.1.p1  ORF type:complete len:240 (-),score=37.62 GILJ01016372.1:79-798(-)